MAENGDPGYTYRSGDEVQVDMSRLFVALQSCIQQKELDRAKAIANSLTWEMREGVSRTHYGTLLIMSTMNFGSDREAFVDFLLDEGFANIEHTVSIVTYGEWMIKITPLCFFACFNNLDGVRTLLQRGADINSPSAQATPVRLACFNHHFDMVKFLVENGADINRPDYRGKTCLMASVGDVDLCRFLIEQHASVNAVDDCADSVLHWAILANRPASVQLLLQHGADPSMRNYDGDDALQKAALSGKPETLECLIENLNPIPTKRADMYALLAATITENGAVSGALPFWIKSAKIRMEEVTPNDVVLVAPNEAYNFSVEAQDIDSVMNISQNHDAMVMQALVVRERILGPAHYKVSLGVLETAADYAEITDYRRCLDMSKYALRKFRLDLTGHRRFHYEDTLRKLCQILRRIGNQNPVSIRRENICDILQSVVEQIAGIMSSSAAFAAEQTVLPLVAFHLIHLLCCLTPTEEDSSTFMQLVHALIQTRFRTVDGQTLLHIAANPHTYVKDAEDEDDARISNQPTSAVVERLLIAGAPVNIVDSAGNTPLHVAAFNPPGTSMTEDWEKAIQLLVNHGAYVDAANAKREVASDKLPASVNFFKHINLTCLAARAVRDYQLPYREIVPKTLADFVECH